jgi:hypothetical protein
MQWKRESWFVTAAAAAAVGVCKRKNAQRCVRWDANALMSAWMNLWWYCTTNTSACMAHKYLLIYAKKRRQLNVKKREAAAATGETQTK